MKYNNVHNLSIFIKIIDEFYKLKNIEQNEAVAMMIIDKIKELKQINYYGSMYLI